MASLGTNSPIASELLVDLKRGVGLPLHRQVELTLRQGIRSGRLAGGGAAPTRTLAAELGVSGVWSSRPTRNSSPRAT